MTRAQRRATAPQTARHPRTAPRATAITDQSWTVAAAAAAVAESTTTGDDPDREPIALGPIRPASDPRRTPSTAIAQVPRVTAHA